MALSVIQSSHVVSDVIWDLVQALGHDVLEMPAQIKVGLIQLVMK